MEKGMQNSVFFQNATNFQNLDDMQSFYRQFARPVLCPVMAIPQDMLCNMQGLGNIPPDLSKEKIRKSSVQKVFISSTSCFQSYKTHRRNRTSSRDFRRDAAVLTSKQSLIRKTQQRDIGTPTSTIDRDSSSSRNIQYLYKKDRNTDSYLLKDAQCGNEENYVPSRETDRDARVKRLLQKLLAARKRDQQLRTHFINSEIDPQFVIDDNGDLTHIRSQFKPHKNNNDHVYDTYYANCHNYFVNSNRRRASQSYKIKSRRNLPKRQMRNNKQSCCYPMSSQGRLLMLQKEKAERSKLIQSQLQKEFSTTCDSSCECHDFNYYNRKIKDLITEYGEAIECDKTCWPSTKTKRNQEPRHNVSQFDESFIKAKKQMAKNYFKQFDISYPPCSCFPVDSNDTHTLSSIATDTDSSRIESTKQKCVKSKQDIGIMQSITRQQDLHVQTDDHMCDGRKSDSFPYLCSCFKKKKVQDKAILTRSCCKNNLKSNEVQTEVYLVSQENGVQTYDCLCSEDNIQMTEKNNKQKNSFWNSKDTENFKIQGVCPVVATKIKNIVDQKMKDVYPSTTDDTVREIHKEKLQGIFDKYSDVKTAINNITPQNILGKCGVKSQDYCSSNANFQKRCERLCEQLDKQQRDVTQLSKNSGSNEFLLNVMHRLDELTKLINCYVSDNSTTSNKKYVPNVQKDQIISKFCCYNLQKIETKRPSKHDADTISSVIAMQNAGTQFGGSPTKLGEVFQDETNKIKRVRKDVEDIINDIMFKVNAVETLKTQGRGLITKNSKATIDFINKCTVNSMNVNKSTEVRTIYRKMSIAVNTDPLGLVSLLKMSTEALMRFLSYFPMVSSNPIFGIAYKQCVSHYVCNICGAIFQKSSQLSDHIEEKHNFDEIRDCCICRHTLELQQQPLDGAFTCQYCGRHFTRAYCCELHQQDCAKKHGLRPEVGSSLALLK